VSAAQDDLIARLCRRRTEIEQALLIRTTAISSASFSDDPEYREGFRGALSAAFDFTLAVIGLTDDEPPPVPAEILRQTRLAARHSVGLDTVLRRCVAGWTYLESLILDQLAGDDLHPLLRSRGVALELLLSQVSAEYERERTARSRSRDVRQFERVVRLLRGEPAESSYLAYDLDLNHVGVVGRGLDVGEAIAALSKDLDSRLLLVRPDEETVWAWLGRRGSLHGDQVQRALGRHAPPGRCLAIGEPAAGLGGWRQTHLQAKASLPVALKSATRQARYADVCLIALAIQDDLLRSSLYSLYLHPLLADSRAEMTYVDTLRAYFAADRNGASAASSLGVSRQTVVKRLRAVEERLGCSLSSCASAVELAVGMIDLEV
jgi:hypothetical protein